MIGASFIALTCIQAILPILKQWYIYIRRGGRYEQLVVLLCMDPTKNVGGASGCIVSELPKVDAILRPFNLL